MIIEGGIFFDMGVTIGDEKLYPQGQQIFTNVGTFSFTPPANVTSISVVCIGGGGCGRRGSTAAAGSGGGGGGLGWKNNIPISANSNIIVTVGDGGTNDASGPSRAASGNASYLTLNGTILCFGGGGTGGWLGPSGLSINPGGAGGAGTAQNDGGGTGGNGYDARGLLASGGAGAGGYIFRGGDGYTLTIGNRQGNGGAGAGANEGDYYNPTNSPDGGTGAGGGGGVSVYGIGAPGIASANTRIGGGGGSGGNAGGNVAAGVRNGAAGGLYGGGGGGAGGSSPTSPTGRGGFGANGAVRIIWGRNRKFPESYTSDVMTYIG